MKQLFILLVIFSITNKIFAQNNIGIGTPSPDPSAILDLTSSDKGFLVPRLPDTTAVTAPYTDGLVFYNTTQKCLYVFRAGIGWLNLCNVNIPIGPTGSTGATGIQGNTGPTGSQGIAGTAGANGAQGIQGVQGNTGPTGNQGIQGIQGNTGPTGATGALGVQGNTGPTGDQGIQGIQGIQGVQGNTGSTGATGVQGNTGATGDQGIQGIQGVQGNTGPTGDQGIQGVQGIPGNTGPTGDQGIQGVQGIQGNTGPTGDQGIQGTQGIQGNTGPTGDQGIQGIQGNTGPTGDQGIQGIQGNTGPTGDQGIQGIQGNTGATGTQGIQGNTGPTGDQGIQGIQGNTGATGTQGIQGNTGPTGDQGIQGIQGNTGPTGDQGIQGIQGNTGATGATGTQGIQGIQGNTGPTGDQGIQGNTGATGDQGIQGIQGNTGPTGDQGIQGIQGIQGNTGPTGDQGIQGIQGNTGATGATGTQGIQGIQGNTGPTGDQGIQGIQGIQGNTGSTGTTGPTGPLGAASGDLSGTYPGPTVVGLQGTPIINTPPVTNNILEFNGTDWVPADPNGIFWRLLGNAGTTPSTSAIGTAANNNFIGTTDAKDFLIATNKFERMRIASGGNVGIGNKVPHERLEVTGNIRLYNGSTASVGTPINVYTPSTAGDNWGANLNIIGGSSPYTPPGGACGGGASIGVTAGNTYTFGPPNCTSSSVNGNAIATGSVVISAGVNMGTSLYNGNIYFYAGQGAGYTAPNASNAQRMIIEGDNGYVGIGTSTPAVQTEISAAATELLKLTSTTGGIGNKSYIDFLTYTGTGVMGRMGCYDNGSFVGSLVFEVNNSGALNGTTTTEAMRIVNTGSVGIGTTTPITLLQVNGAITSSGGGAYLDGAVDGSNYKVVFANANGTLVKDNVPSAADKPIYIQRFTCSCDNPTRNTGVSTANYTAVMVGFNTNSAGASNSTTSIVYQTGGTWWFHGDEQGPNENYWYVDIMFIRNSLVNDLRPTGSYQGAATSF